MTIAENIVMLTEAIDECAQAEQSAVTELSRAKHRKMREWLEELADRRALL
jgi:hypothetical protein